MDTDYLDDNYIYEINVSGKVYNIKHKILKKIPYFDEFIQTKEPKCFVERSSMVFDHVLAYAIDPLHPYPAKYFYELDFYGLTYERMIYKVNVLGRIYYLKREILEKIPYFVKIINKVGNSSVEIFVERSPSLFENVITYVTNNGHPVECLDELDFYEITYNRYKLINNKTDLCAAKDSIERETDKILSNLRDMYEDITKIHTKLDEIKQPNSNIKTCKYSECTNYVQGEDTNYCYDHGECKRCYEDATRDNDFLCNIHQDY